MVALYFGHVSLHSSALPIPVNQTPKLIEIMCLQMLYLPCAFLSYSCLFCIPALLESSNSNKPLLITSVTDMCQRKPCVVCPAPAALCSTQLSCSNDRRVHHSRDPLSRLSFAALDLLPRRRQPRQLHYHHQLSRWPWGLHGSAREVALFRVCLCYASLNMMTCYIIVVFTY